MYLLHCSLGADICALLLHDRHASTKDEEQQDAHARGGKVTGITLQGYAPDRVSKMANQTCAQKDTHFCKY